jgi:sortase A
VAVPPSPTRRRRSRADFVVRFIGVLGRVFVLAGVLLLFFTAYLLWGTGVYTKQQQNTFEKTLANKPIVADRDVTGDKIPAARPSRPPKLGEPLFSLKVPKIGLDTVIVNGVGREELKKGAGLFPQCPTGGEECVREAKYPGEKGNVAISGHRTTYGAPFFRLNELQKGDTVDFVSGRARYRYKVREQKIVDPVAGFPAVEQHGRDEVTLTTCHPRFSAAQRLIIHADYVGSSLISGGPRGRGPAPRSDTPVIPTDVLVLASIALASALGSLALSKRYRVAAAYIALGLVGASGLWIAAFPRVVALMPANY